MSPYQRDRYFEYGVLDMSKERNVLLRIASFSVEAGEAAVGARPATVASHTISDSGMRGVATRSGAVGSRETRRRRLQAKAAPVV